MRRISESGGLANLSLFMETNLAHGEAWCSPPRIFRLPMDNCAMARTVGAAQDNRPGVRACGQPALRSRASLAADRSWTSNEAIDRADLSSAQDRYAFGREILDEITASLPDLVDESVQMPHCAGRQVVHDQQGPGLSGALRQRAIYPTFGVVPIVRHAIPQHTGIAATTQVVISFETEQMAAKHSTAAKGPK